MLAQASGPVGVLIGRVATYIINPAIKLMFIIALAYFLWGMVQFIRKADSEDGRTDGKRHMLWGVIGMAIMVSVNSIISLAVRTLESVAR